MQYTERRLSKWTMGFYGFGYEAEGIKDAAFGILLLFFYQQVVGLSGTLTGIAIAIALIIDALTDPIIGSISDRFVHRLGRRHPFMLIATLPLAITFVALFNPPGELTELALFFWLTFFAVAVRLSMTFYQIPLLALGADLSAGPVERANLFNSAAIFKSAGTATLAVIAYPVFFPTTSLFEPGTLNPEAYLPFSIFFAFWMVMIMLISIAATSHEISTLKLKELQKTSRSHFMDGYRSIIRAFRYSAFARLFVFMLAVALIAAFGNVFGPYIAFHFWEFTTEEIAIITASAIPSILLAIFIVPFLAARFEKRNILIVSTLGMIFVGSWAVVARLLELPWFPENGSPLLLAIGIFNVLCTGILTPVTISAGDSMLADVADEITLGAGEAMEGVVFSARAFLFKAANSLGLIAGGFALDVIQFPTNASVGTVPAETIWQLGFYSGPLPGILNCLALLLLIGYPLTKSKHETIREQLFALRQDQAHG